MLPDSFLYIRSQWVNSGAALNKIGVIARIGQLRFMAPITPVRASGNQLIMYKLCWNEFTFLGCFKSYLLLIIGFFLLGFRKMLVNSQQLFKAKVLVLFGFLGALSCFNSSSANCFL